MSINDELIWQQLNGQFCSFKAKVQTQNFCRNEMNVTGLCNKSACPLANSRYATIREIDGKCYLMVKTIERAHLPSRLWQKIKLPRNYAAALEKVTTELEHFPKYLQHRNKQRLTRIHQYLMRMRKLALRSRPTLTTVKKKVERREDRKEVKALTAAKLSKSIEAELLQRLKQGTYGDIYNFESTAWNEALDKEQSLDQNALEAESEEEDEEDRLADMIEYCEADESEDEIEDAAEAIVTDEPVVRRAKRKAPARARVAIEYDDEESEAEAEPVAAMAF